MNTCIIIDDEQFAVEGLTEYLDKFGGYRIVKYYLDPVAALREISTQPPVDLIFLDVDMPDINGLELSAAIRDKARKLVFTTAHSRFAFPAFEAQADGFLLKPYPFAKLAQLLNRLLPREDRKDPPTGTNDYFFVKNKEEDLKLVKVLFSEVIAVESIRNYVKIYTFHKVITTYSSLREIKQLFNGPDFLQIHRAFIIAKAHIVSVQGNSVLLKGDIKMSVGEHFREDFHAFITDKTFRITPRDPEARN